MPTRGTVRDIGGNITGAWAQARVLPTGHYVEFFPGGSSRPNTLVVRDRNGTELANHGEAVRDFDAGIDPATGAIFVQWSPFNNGATWSHWRRWDTGIMVVASGTQPPPAGTQLDRIEAGIAAIRSKIGA